MAGEGWWSTHWSLGRRLRCRARENVDERSFVIGVLMGVETFRTADGAYGLKPRGVLHTY